MNHPPPLLPPWAIAAILATAVVLSVATTLITLGLEHARRARREEEAAAGPQPSEPAPSTPPASRAEQAEILSSHPARDRA